MDGHTTKLQGTYVRQLRKQYGERRRDRSNHRNTPVPISTWVHSLSRMANAELCREWSRHV